MKLRRLRLTGFKSFVEPTELRIERGLTGVVGPNGCGKSNLLEAIRWVMGESSPKSMRGGGMEDVIFAGTALRPARDFAEVTLVCDSEGAVLPGVMGPSDGTALEIIRRIERGAGSAYRANGQDVRARDVALIFADASTGAHSPALVSQGKIAAIVSAKPQDRRVLLEEAAGISGLHVRRKDAEQKLRATENNLSRLSDILQDMDSRANALRRQARAAERYARLSDQIRVAEGQMIYARWRDAAAAASTAKTEAQDAETRVERASTQQQALAAEHAAAQAALASARAELMAGQARQQAAMAHLAEIRAERASLIRQRDDLAAERARMIADREAEDSLARDGAVAIAQCETAARTAIAAIKAREADKPAQETLAAQIADQLRDADVALADARAEVANDAAERRIAEAAAAEATRRLAQITADYARLDAELNAAGDEAALLAALTAAQEAQTLCETDRKHSAERAVELADRRAAAADTSAATQTALVEVRTALASLESERAALQRSLDAGRHNTDGVLAALSVTPGYEAALAAALGDDLSAPLLTSTTLAGARGWAGAAVDANDPPLPAGTTALADHVDAPPPLARRLAQIAVTDTDSGQPLALGQRLVTVGGALRRWDGFVSHGDGAATAERLARTNRLSAITAQIPTVAGAVEELDRKALDAKQALSAAEAAITAHRQAEAALETRERSARNMLHNAETALARLAATRDHVEGRLAALVTERADGDAAMDAALARVAALPDGAVAAARLSAADSEAARLRAAMANVREELATLDRDIARLRGEQIEAEADLRGWKGRIGEAARRITTMETRIVAIDNQLDASATRPSELEIAVADAEQEANAAQAAVAAAIDSETTSVAAVRTADAALDQAREALSSAREARAGAQARADNAEQRRIEMGRISGERFQCPPPLLPTQLGFDAESTPSPQEASQLHERLSSERERIGPVNLVAAQELAELETEQATSTAEAEELQLAVNRLRGSIGHLNREGRQRLLDAFSQVDTHFRTLFETLFQGGQAHLALVESDDPLEAGLEIMAQPPGKKLSSLTLLSGGEQALTAVALIFALFLTKPAPICVLDEVDAPLDDANVERFCDLLDRMVRKTSTRYLIVTHNAVTMSRMHRLFGVTMVEPGVSRLVSVDLGGAEQLLAAE
ncbi:MAG: chromosome segregation protein SMC [Sphingopyxis sp.]|nr:chromosome segregation protein SMC [Sphingopyxis sp.]